MARARVIGIIQARIGSTRLPRKVLLPLAGKAVLEHVIARVGSSSQIDEVVVATTIAAGDARIAALCDGLQVRVFRGSEDDVLDRFYRSARLLKAEHVVRITADCPLMDPDIIDLIVSRHLVSKADYTSNTLLPTYPDGEDVEVLTVDALERAWRDATLRSEREHVTPYLTSHPEIFNLVNVKNAVDLSAKRWTLDREVDYDFLKTIFARLYPRNPLFGMREVLDFLKDNPDVEKKNMNISRNEGYRISLKEDGPVKGISRHTEK